MAHRRETVRPRRGALVAALVLLGAASSCERAPTTPTPRGFRGPEPTEDPSEPLLDDGRLVTTEAGLRFEMPADWEWVAEPSGPRQAECLLPSLDDEERPRLTIHHFGDAAGSVEQNLIRWAAQFADGAAREGAEGSADEAESPLSRARVETETIRDFEVTRIWLAGRYVAETHPGSGVREDRPGWALLGAILETDDGAFYVKVTGPARSVAAVDPAVTRMLRTATLGP